MHDEAVYRITLVRHCESIGNAEERLQGHADYPLSARGRQQANALAQRWKYEAVSFDHVTSSPLTRAHQTGRIIAAGLGIATVETDPLWIERDVGEHTGLTWDEVDRQQPKHDDDRRDAIAGTGENEWAAYLRGGEAVASILKRPPARYLVISHQTILNMAIYAILGIVPPAGLQGGARFRIRNGSISRFRYDSLARRWQVDVIGDRSHWKDDE